jgi:hypothetical protein
MPLRCLLLAMGVLLAAVSLGVAQPLAGARAKQTTAQMIASIEREHPAAYYELAIQLFREGKEDEAVFWFYTGQIRYRARLATHPELRRDGEPALFGSLSEVVGRPINQHAFGDIPKLAETIDRALAWDAAHKDPFSPNGAARENVRAGLAEMKRQTLARADEIRATRVKNGLKNRTP